MMIDGWGKLISFVGVPSAIALYLVWTVTSQVQADIRLIKEQVSAHVIMNSSAQQTNVQIYLLLQRICVNTAKQGLADGCFWGELK